MSASEADFRQFVDTRYTDLLRLAYALTGSAHEAEDLVQGALVKVMRRWRRVEDPMAYLRRVMINQRTSGWRRFGAREVVTATPPDRPVGDGTAAVDDRQTVLAALRGLPPRMRAAVALRYVADLSEAETAATLGCSVGTVKSQTSKGLARLREALEPVRPLNSGRRA
ncbi:SigE family RNA polymerase sigma factor [Virgisporangium aurantiacum]|uniref:RNA polymerase sigma-E factor n=1 Tax=Virgisporangium aurantiacum TaxID=175570 RepID=A0A8J4E1Q7_9ACTN|nr:SigE family RNA polymerase sigma factor [Virgisporangium aurantiacum]GIJ59035.1 RNA polymerase sigma-E factor [Virgisporangium aurantiacum]